MLNEKIFRTIIALSVVVSIFGGCTPTTTSTPIPSQTPSAPILSEQTSESATSPAPNTNEDQKLLLSDSLRKGCQRGRYVGGLDKAGLPVGETAVDFTLKDTDGATVSLSGLLGEKPVVMIFGSFT